MSKSAAAPVNLAEKLSQFNELWSQKKVAVLNDYEVKLAKLKGEFVWHTHEDTDELFLVISGRLTLQLRDGTVVLEPGELFVVPSGIEHCPVADEETAILLFEPAGTINTGDAGGPMTKPAEILS
ncbi:cupin domain-containing protein [Streptomyces sp. NPDC048248]|uniref:cupin domain-containing protein n=1 Tax=Streptomyces sp. NPDC048248 TaxID=3365523 RepID=UPI003717A864